MALGNTREERRVLITRFGHFGPGARLLSQPMEFQSENLDEACAAQGRG